MTDQALLELVLEEFSCVIPPLYRKIQAFRLKIGRDLSFSRLQMEILTALDQAVALSITELAKTLVVAKPNVTTAVDDLVNRSFVVRENQREDRRIVLLKLTLAGTEVRKKIQRQFRKVVSTSLAALPDHELEALMKGLKSLDAVVTSMQIEPL